MKHWGPLVTALLAVLGLVGFLVVNSVGGLVAADQPDGPATQPPATTTQAPTTTAQAPRFPAEVVYAGKADGSNVAIAVAVKGGQAVAYLCDGKNVEAWLRGTAKNGQLSVVSDDDSALLTATMAGKGINGTAVAGDLEFTFTIGPAEPPAGLYRGEDGDTTIGWIVLPDGSQVGIASTDGESSPAPELEPADGTASLDGKRVSGGPVAGDSDF